MNVNPKQLIADVTYENHGSIVLVRAGTPEGKAHLSDHMPEDCARMGLAYAVEPRYFTAIHADLLDSGLDVRGH